MYVVPRLPVTRLRVRQPPVQVRTLCPTLLPFPFQSGTGAELSLASVVLPPPTYSTPSLSNPVGKLAAFFSSLVPMTLVILSLSLSLCLRGSGSQDGNKALIRVQISLLATDTTTLYVTTTTLYLHSYNFY